jgi:diguanylate cyclase (GGDEF)-like protein
MEIKRATALNFSILNGTPGFLCQKENGVKQFLFQIETGRFMSSNKTQWGTVFYLASIALLGGLYCLFAMVPAGMNPLLYKKVLPVLGLLFSGFVLFFGHFSYPRLHSVKVYFLGYGIGLTGIAFFVMGKPLFKAQILDRHSQGFVELLVIVSLVNLIIASIVPSDTKYRVTRSVTLAIVTAEAVLLAILRLGPNTAALLNSFFYDSAAYPVFWIGPALFIAATLLSIWRIRSEFFLGGIVAGCALILVLAWTCRLASPAHTDLLHLLLFSGMPLFLSCGMVIHGFSRMEHRISFDPLLKIYNRDYCSRIITEQANINVSPPFAVAMVDIDHFKQVNDTYGHQAGDAVLHAVAQAVQHGAGQQGISCRYGGEELAIFFPQKTSKEVAVIVEKIRTDIEKIKTRSGKKKISVTISAGISHRESFSQTIVEVIQASDKALYAAKNGGRNQVKTQKTPLGTTRKQSVVT